MKIRIISDLHVDMPRTFGFEDKLNETDLVLIAGDISNSKQGVIQYLDNLKTKSKVVFIRGNHEGYSQPNFPPHIDTVDSIIADLRLKYTKDGNVTFLENDCIIKKEEQVFIGIPAEYPTELINELCVYFDKEKSRNYNTIS